MQILRTDKDVRPYVCIKSTLCRVRFFANAQNDKSVRTVGVDDSATRKRTAARAVSTICKTTDRSSGRLQKIGMLRLLPHPAKIPASAKKSADAGKNFIYADRIRCFWDYSSICLPRKDAATCKSFCSSSVGMEPSSRSISITAPETSPPPIIGNASAASFS